MLDLAESENSTWSETLREELEESQRKFEDQSRRMRMSAADLEFAYEL